MKATELTDSTFEEMVGKAEVAIVDFWAEWCGPCKALTPIVEELGEDYAGKVKVVKMDIEANPQTPMKYSIRNIPTLLFFKNGEKVDKQVGLVPKKKLEKKLNALL